MKPLFTPPMRWPARLLAAALVFHLLDYSHSVWLSVHPKHCFDEMSPDKHYILRICTLRWGEKYFPITYVQTVQIIDPRTHKVLYENLESGSEVSDTIWLGCREKKWPENDLESLDAGICAAVCWSREGGVCEIKTELPPSRWEQFKARFP